MKFVYGIAFDGDCFVMVFNPKRMGWEMPGGAIEGEETPEEAMIREFSEEVGHEFVAVASLTMGEGTIFAGRMERRSGIGEMKWMCFDELPKDLSFPEVEYRGLVEWARSRVGGGRTLNS